jgi:hypothetical protein
VSTPYRPDPPPPRIRVQRLSIVLGSEWRVAPPCTDSGITDLFGLYVSHGASGLAFHVRSYPAVGDAATLVRDLENQSWASPPFDRVWRRAGALFIAAATFLYVDRRAYVREWRISDGVNGADASLFLPDPAAVPAGIFAACDALLDSIEFE